MEYKYMKKMAKTPIIHKIENEPLTDVQIESIEQEINKKFPISFREFLLLGGNSANMLNDMSNGCFIEERKYWKETQEKCKKEVAEMNVKMEKDFWVFADLDESQFHFFYFDEEDDPKVYHYCSYLDNEDFTEEYAGIRDIGKTFSEYINNRIDVAKERGWS